MKTPEQMFSPIQTRGDFRQLTESASDVKTRDFDIPDNHPLWELWTRFTEFYGAAFVSQYGEEPSATWVFALQDLSTADFGVGMAALKTRSSPFPPNPGEFMALCVPETPEQRRLRVGNFPTGITFNPSPEFRLEQIKKLRERHGL